MECPICLETADIRETHPENTRVQMIRCEDCGLVVGYLQDFDAPPYDYEREQRLPKRSRSRSKRTR
jgi:hypothetical protein